MRKKLKAAIRRKINKDLSDLTSPLYKTKYFDKIPLQDIFNILNKYGLIPLQEDNTEWSGLLLGRQAEVNFEISPVDTKNEQDMYIPYENTMMRLSWYKMQSGRYEIVCYLS